MFSKTGAKIGWSDSSDSETDFPRIVRSERTMLSGAGPSGTRMPPLLEKPTSRKEGYPVPGTSGCYANRMYNAMPVQKKVATSVRAGDIAHALKYQTFNYKDKIMIAAACERFLGHRAKYSGHKCRTLFRPSLETSIGSDNSPRTRDINKKQTNVVIENTKNNTVITANANYSAYINKSRKKGNATSKKELPKKNDGLIERDSEAKKHEKKISDPKTRVLDAWDTDFGLESDDQIRSSTKNGYVKKNTTLKKELPKKNVRQIERKHEVEKHEKKDKSKLDQTKPKRVLETQIHKYFWDADSSDDQCTFFFKEPAVKKKGETDINQSTSIGSDNSPRTRDINKKQTNAVIENTKNDTVITANANYSAYINKSRKKGNATSKKELPKKNDGLIERDSEAKKNDKKISDPKTRVLDAWDTDFGLESDDQIRSFTKNCYAKENTTSKKELPKKNDRQIEREPEMETHEEKKDKSKLDQTKPKRVMETQIHKYQIHKYFWDTDSSDDQCTFFFKEPFKKKGETEKKKAETEKIKCDTEEKKAETQKEKKVETDKKKGGTEKKKGVEKPMPKKLGSNNNNPKTKTAQTCLANNDTMLTEEKKQRPMRTCRIKKLVNYK